MNAPPKSPAPPPPKGKPSELSPAVGTVDQPREEGAVAEARVAGLGELEIQVELRQVGRARLPHQARELGEALAGEAHLGVQLRSDVHRLRDRERERFLLEEVAILVQDPVGDGAFPLLSRTLLGGRHGREGQQQRRGAQRFPPAAAARIERFHRFSFRRFPSCRRAGSGTLRERRDLLPVRSREVFPVPDPTSHLEQRTIRYSASTIRTLRVFRRNSSPATARRLGAPALAGTRAAGPQSA